jgi:hypothetical protein
MKMPQRLEIAAKELRSFNTDLQLSGPMPNQAAALAHARLALSHIAMAQLHLGASEFPFPQQVMQRLNKMFDNWK